MATRSRGQGVTTPIPADQRQYYLLPYSITTLHGRGRKGTKKKPHRIHGRPRHPDPWKHKGIAAGQ